ncbi:MAG: hypothetical protein GY950_36570, partial [bacterium]|nr:hypothetical protein [bacterium]
MEHVKQLNQKIRTIFVNLNSTAQMIIIGVIVGLVSGLAAVGLTRGLHFFHDLFHQLEGRFYFYLFPLAGIVLAVLFLKFIARDFGGHGVPEVIHSVG